MFVHRPQYLSFSFCSVNDDQVYYDMMLFYVLMPIGCILALALMGVITYHLAIMKNAKEKNMSNQWIDVNKEILRTNIFRILLLFCLTIYPIVTSEFLLFFDCRSFGTRGSFLRGNYAVECYTDRYDSRIYLAICGIILFGGGIPIFFYYVVKHRNETAFGNSSVVLHRSFKENYKQFEIVALFHKVTLFSLVSFVARPGTPSQCLFLLLCNLGYLGILAILKPYDFRTDTVLAITFTSIECFAFLVAFLVISGVADSENYSMDAIFDTLYAFLIISICLLTPSFYAMKYDRVNRMIKQKTGVAANRVRKMARSSARRSSGLLSSIRSRANSMSSRDNDSVRLSVINDSTNGGVNVELGGGPVQDHMPDY